MAPAGNDGALFACGGACPFAALPAVMAASLSQGPGAWHAGNESEASVHTASGEQRGSWQRFAMSIRWANGALRPTELDPKGSLYRAAPAQSSIHKAASYSYFSKAALHTQSCIYEA